MQLYPLNRGGRWPQSRSEHLEKKKTSYTYRQSNKDFSVVQPETITLTPKPGVFNLSDSAGHNFNDARGPQSYT
jgi:hypothetical protein